jgi:endonuclease/exonuclease/phosphatase family metal-dependent hydrolase
MILLAGDFNSPPNDGAYRIMTSTESSMEDIRRKVPKEKRHGNEVTFTSFTPSEKQLQRIDFLFSQRRDKLKFDTYAVLANRFDNGDFSSDHRACAVDVQLLSRWLTLWGDTFASICCNPFYTLREL